MTLVMFDAVDTTQLPKGGDAYAGYVGGRWVTFPVLQKLFPRAHLLSIAISSSEDAECLDIENGDAEPVDAPAWVFRQHRRGITRPVLYGSAGIMQAILLAISAAGIPATDVRLWSAHYTLQPHICGPHSCGAISFDVDGTQWTDQALGRQLDQSELDDSFFTTTAPAPKEEPPMLTGQINGKTDIVLPDGIKGELRLGCSMPAVLQVDMRDGKPERVFDLTDASTESAEIPAGIHMVVVHVKTAAPDGTLPGYAIW